VKLFAVAQPRPGSQPERQDQRKSIDDTCSPKEAAREVFPGKFNKSHASHNKIKVTTPLYLGPKSGKGSLPACPLTASGRAECVKVYETLHQLRYI
jgi:hypothetical protein